MSSRKIYAQILGLDNTMSLKDVQNIMKELDYTEEISYLSNEKNLSKEDKTLFNKWGTPSEIETYKTNYKFEEEVVHFFTNKGYIEEAVPKKEAYIDEDFKELLPRNKRIKMLEVDTIFFEYAGRVHAIIYGGKGDMILKSKLMGQGYRSRRKNEWSRLEFPLTQFDLDSDFFYWIYYNYTNDNDLNTPNGNIKITDVEGIGRYSERKQHNTRGTGPKSTSELSHLTALGINQFVYETDLLLNYENKYKISFCLDTDSSVNLDKSRSLIINSNNDDVDSINGKENEILLLFYLDILPGLIRTYNSEHSIWNGNISNNVRREYALKVVRELCDIHNIKPKEIQNREYV